MARDTAATSIMASGRCTTPGWVERMSCSAGAHRTSATRKPDYTTELPTSARLWDDRVARLILRVCKVWGLKQLVITFYLTCARIALITFLVFSEVNTSRR